MRLLRRRDTFSLDDRDNARDQARIERECRARLKAMADAGDQEAVRVLRELDEQAAARRERQAKATAQPTPAPR
jgi:hypothetical protein